MSATEPLIPMTGRIDISRDGHCCRGNGNSQFGAGRIDLWPTPSRFRRSVGAASMLDVFRLVQERHVGIGAFPGMKPQAHFTTTWLITASINIAFGAWIFPHIFQLCYSADGVTTIRRNAIWQPLYSLCYFFIILLGFAALLANVRPSPCSRLQRRISGKSAHPSGIRV